MIQTFKWVFFSHSRMCKICFQQKEKPLALFRKTIGSNDYLILIENKFQVFKIATPKFNVTVHTAKWVKCTYLWPLMELLWIFCCSALSSLLYGTGLRYNTYILTHPTSTFHHTSHNSRRKPSQHTPPYPIYIYASHSHPHIHHLHTLISTYTKGPLTSNYKRGLMQKGGS